MVTKPLFKTFLGWHSEPLAPAYALPPVLTLLASHCSELTQGGSPEACWPRRGNDRPAAARRPTGREVARGEVIGRRPCGGRWAGPVGMDNVLIQARMA